MATCYALLKGCKRADERLDWSFNWTHELARKWKPNMPFAANVKVRPSALDQQTGLQYSSSGGQSGSEEPEWPTAEGETVIDGPITWTAESLDTDSLTDQVNFSTWEADSAVTVDGQNTSITAGLQLSYAYVSGGVARRTYDVVNTVTTQGGRIFEGVLRLRIDD